LIEILTQLAHHKWLIAKVVGIAMLAGVVISLTLATRYTATTKVMPPSQTQSEASLFINQLASSSAGSLAAAAGGGFGLKDPNDIYIGLLNSRTIADAIIQKFGLANEYHAKDMTASREALAGNTKIASEKSGFIAISVTDTNKKRAADIANAYTEQLRVLTQSLRVTEASQRRFFYEGQLKQAQEDLIAAELSFQQVQQKKGLVQLDAQAKAVIESLAALHAQVAAKQVELYGLRLSSTESNPNVQLAENQLSTLQGETFQLEQRNHSLGPGELGLQDVAGAGLQYLRAEHELQYQQMVFDLLLKQYDAARLDEAKEAAVIQVVESATPPDQKSSPHRTLIVLAFGMLGFLGACTWLVVADLIHQSPGH
jgi:uncharacterized protein involved in exopolysaccharide biosynthesis